MNPALRYEPVDPVARAEAERALASDDLVVVTNALVAVAFHDPDRQWVEEQCFRLLSDPRDDVRRLAATCVGHLARIHGELDLERALPLLEALRADPEVGGTADDALGDIAIFLPRRRRLWARLRGWRRR